jgi:hypothetical protein
VGTTDGSGTGGTPAAASKVTGDRVGSVARFHHVNLGIPVGGTEAEAEFLVGLLGYTRLQPPAELASLAKWFEAADGYELAALERAFDDAGYLYKQFDSQGLRILFCEDPAGNRWELRGPAAH